MSSHRGRRAFRALRNLVADRNRPPVSELLAETDSEKFLWRALPHAARTFSLAIALLPDPLGTSVGTAYLFCRALDTVEDLATSPDSRDEAMAAVVALADGAKVEIPLPEATVQDSRDLGHLAVLRRFDLLLALRDSLSLDSRRRLSELVTHMAKGMREAALAKDVSGGLLRSDQRPGYCAAVLGAPLRFAESEHRALLGLDPDLSAARRALVEAAGEVVQLANICRDIEKDLARGIAYDEALAPYIAMRVAPPEVVAGVRRSLCLRIASMSAEFSAYFSGMGFRGGISGARGGAAIMLVATSSFWQRSSQRLSPAPLVSGPMPGKMGLLWEAWRAALSPAGLEGVIARHAVGLRSSLGT